MGRPCKMTGNVPLRSRSFKRQQILHINKLNISTFLQTRLTEFVGTRFKTHTTICECFQFQ